MKRKSRQNKHAKGITLIALVITIIVLLILAGVAINALFGDNGLITKAQLSSFATEMKTIKENVRLKQNENAMKLATEKTSEETFTEKLDTSKLKVSTTFLQQVQYTRDGYPSDKEPTAYKEDEYNKLLGQDGIIEGIYVLDKKTGNGKENTYVYDQKSDVVFKIPKTNIGGKTYHSYEVAQLQKGGSSKDGEDTPEKDQIITEESEIVTVGDEKYYGPNMSGFDAKNTNLIYYSSDFNSQVELTAKEYIEQGQKYQIEKDGMTYTLHNYGSRMWANAKTNANDLEAWWVWVPRYAYKINGTGDLDVIYVDTANKPLNTVKAPDGTLPEGYIVHPAFTVDGNELKGIWMSKYDPNYEIQPLAKGNLAPDMEGFDKNNTYIELYDSTTETFSEEVKLADADLNTVNKDKKWYDYENQVWANVKTNANGIEAWWVWIPRYAYRIQDLTNYKITDIICIGLDNKPLDKAKYPDGLPEGYIVHPAFTVDGNELSGIWMSKYDPNYEIQSLAKGNLAPDMEGFDKDNTYIELYDSETGTFAEEIKLADADLSTINNDKKWYDYENQVWANVKTNANGIEAWWVWTPRYAYRIQDLTNYKITDIIFIGTDNKPLDKEKYPDGLPDGYIVHPAFTVDGNELKGIWMSKYDPSQEAYN